MTSWTRSGLLAATLIALAPQARADIYDDAWDCASAVVDTVELGFTMGPKALKFVATQPSCVARLGTPATAAPIGVVVGLANTGVLPSSQPQCGAKLYDTAAQPLAAALSASLGELGILPGGAADQLAEIAAGEVAGELLTQVPGMSEVGGSLTCGCELVEAGLSVDSIKQVLDTGDQLGNACGGVVWDTAKEVAGEVVEFAGDAAEEGIRQVSNLGDALAGQTKHMAYDQYFNQHWLPRVEDFATMEFNNPGNWHGGQQWRQMWEPCVSYFDGHTQSAETARYTCDNMRSGGDLFPERNFGRLMFRRVFDFDVTVAVADARQQFASGLTSLPLDADLPFELTSDAEALEQADTLWASQASVQLGSVMDKLFGVPTREATHDGLKVYATTPPALYSHGTVGARAQDYFAEVEVNQDRADAARAVELAMEGMDFTGQFAERARGVKRDFYLQHYQFVLTMREHLRDKDLESADNWASQCPTEACREQIRSEYAQCRADTQAWYDDNAALIGDFDSSAGKQAGREWSDRVAGCLAQAKQTAQDNRWHINDSGVGALEGPVDVGQPRRDLFESRVPPQDEGDGRRRDPRAGYRDRAGDTPAESADDSDPMTERLRARRAARDGMVPRVTRDSLPDALRDAGSSELEPDADAGAVTGDELPGCAAVRGMVAPRVYACGTDEAYAQCRRVVQRDANVTCQRARR